MVRVNPSDRPLVSIITILYMDTVWMEMFTCGVGMREALAGRPNVLPPSVEVVRVSPHT